MTPRAKKAASATRRVKFSLVEISITGHSPGSQFGEVLHQCVCLASQGKNANLKIGDIKATVKVTG